MNIDLKRVPVWAYGAAALALLFVLGSAAHSAGWSQGFAFGLLAGGGGEGASAAPYLAYRAGHGFGPAAFFGGFLGGIFRFGLLLLFVAFVARFFCPWRRRHMHHHPEWHGYGPQAGAAQGYPHPHWPHGGWQPPYPPAPGPQPGSQPAAGTAGGETPAGPPPPEQPGQSTGSGSH